MDLLINSEYDTCHLTICASDNTTCRKFTTFVDMADRYSFPQNLAWNHAAVSEKPELHMDGHLLHDSSSSSRAKNGKKLTFICLAFIKMYIR